MDSTIDEQLSAFVEDCKKHSKVKHIVENLDSFDPAMRVILNDKGVSNDDVTIGRRTVDTGVNLFAYLADIVVQRGAEGIPCWNVVTFGYPNQEHTDLFTPYFDVWRTQLLWINAVDQFEAKSHLDKIEAILNILFRWNIASLELMRRMLIFSDYCRTNQAGTFNERKHVNYLHGTGDPSTALKTNAPAGRGSIVCQFYDRTIRHALAHGNICMALPNFAVLRYSDDSKEKFHQREYNFTRDGKAALDQFRIDLLGVSESCYQSIRVFFLIYSKLQSKHEKLLKNYWPQDRDNRVVAKLADYINRH